MNRINLNQFKSELTGYTEIRNQFNSTGVIRLVNGNLVSNTKDETSGISARTFKDGYWGFSSDSIVGTDTFKKVIKNANDNASNMAKYLKKNNKTLPDNNFNIEKDHIIESKRASRDEMINFLKSLDSHIETKYKNLVSRNLFLRDFSTKKDLITSFGSNSYISLCRTHIYIFMTMQSKDGPVEHYKSFGGPGLFFEQFSDPTLLHEEIDTIYKELKEKSEGVYAKAGVKDVILAPNLAGILAHEAIGHTTEADIVLGGSIASDYINQKVASDMVTLVDFAHTYNNELCPLPVYIDDEGVEAKDAVIIENGTLKSFMHNRDTASHFQTNTTGNARAFDFNDEPLIRMRNTVILPGTSKLDEMIESIEDGYYLMNPANGQADSTSEFMFGVNMGYEIKNGKITKAIKDTTISGVAFDMLKTITMLSDDMQWECAGTCGKKQPMPVGMGGPAIKCQITVGGK